LVQVTVSPWSTVTVAGEKLKSAMVTVVAPEATASGAAGAGSGASATGGFSGSAAGCGGAACVGGDAAGSGTGPGSAEEGSSLGLIGSGTTSGS
jgi:hypothetical protein